MKVYTNTTGKDIGERSVTVLKETLEGKKVQSMEKNTGVEQYRRGYQREKRGSTVEDNGGLEGQYGIAGQKSTLEWGMVSM